MNVQLMNHQSDAVNFAVKNNGVAAFFHDVGCGKTLSALATFTALRQKNPQLKLLVICPLSLIHGAWSREINKFTTYNWTDLHSDTARNFNAVDIFLINFESLIVPRRFQEMVEYFTAIPSVNWMCVIDESSKMKNHNSVTVEKLLGRMEKGKYHKGIRDYCQYRIIMSGTPAPNIEWEYWTQMYFLNPQILGENFYKFKNTHFALRRGKQGIAPGVVMNAATIRKMHEQGFKYEIMPAMRERMFAKMRSICHYVRAKDCIDLPEEIDKFHEIALTPAQAKVYKLMKNEYIAELAQDEFVVANVALTKIMKLRQITSGFAITDANAAVPLGTKNPKLDELADIIEQCQDKQIIVWCQFHWEIDKIVDMLTKIAGVSQLHGRVPQSQRNEQLDLFLNGTNRFLVAHPDSAAHGLTLVNCHVCVFFSMDYSMESYSQARGRIYRNGQKNNCIYYHLIAKDTIDEDVLAIVQRKETAQTIAGKYLRAKNP